MKKIFRYMMFVFAVLFALVLTPKTALAASKTTGQLYNGTTFNKKIKKITVGEEDISYIASGVKKIIFTRDSKTYQALKNRTVALPKETVGSGATAYYDAAEGTVYVYSANQMIFDTDCSNMFTGFDNLETITYDKLSSVNVTKVSRMKNMFDFCKKLTYFDAKMFKGIKATNVYGMFAGCQSLKSIDLSGIDLSSVTDLSYIFDGCSNLEYISWKKFDTSKVTTMKGVYHGCKSIKTIVFPDWFTMPNVTDMMFCFDGCLSLVSVDFGKMTAAKVTNMQQMFDGCTSLKSITLSKLNTAKVKDMSWMFVGCTSLESADLHTFNTSNVTDMGHMFKGCTGLKTVNLSGLDIRKVESVAEMFYGCSSLESLDLKDLDFSTVCSKTYYADLILGCDNLKVLTSPKNVTKAIPLKATFALDDNKDGKPDTAEKYKVFPISKTSHRYIRISDEKQTGDYSGSQEYQNDTVVESKPVDKTVKVGSNTYIIHPDGTATVTKIAAKGKVKIDEVKAFGAKHPVTKIADSAAKGNKKIKSLTIGSKVTSIGKNSFKGCKKLKKVTIKANKNLKVGKGAFKKLPKRAVIHVKGIKGHAKKKLVKAIKKQTNATVS
ncbi:surface protein [Butyrivibrio sp. ob235]|uniref:BspA family leucine-rich repeat surface protein n=1 Tax=Butyrivibrio sp. ob235 TaxID=1761780 RepID=UPI0008CE6C40|nr:BspA family leucine-rich repeat surface protein [Butyrivibrio sp. ob235]SEK24871.1 surface protein [Butyrivibrio sp. ob235]